MQRDPSKRKVKPVQSLFDFEELSESSSDSDFRIEDHAESDDDSIDSDDNEQSSDDENDDSDESFHIADKKKAAAAKSKPGPGPGPSNVSLPGPSTEPQQPIKKFDPKDALNIFICSVCLGDKSDSSNEIIECDNCGVTVHEGCYGVQDTDSVSSSDSPTPTTPWFCDACKAGQDDPPCELCPNSGGIFKETDVGKWVHLVCALYVPGAAFGEVDKLQAVTLFEIPYSKWGAKACTLCPDERFARTGIVVGCDAGMCKTHFHVTCGQMEGLLAEAHSDEVDQADPFYAHCKLHTDKTVMRKRRRNYLSLQMRVQEARKRNSILTSETSRIQKKLENYKLRYKNEKLIKPHPWVPTQKMPRLLTTSASACRTLWRKAELSGIDTESYAMRQAQADALADVHRRWHIQPAFSSEFIGYFLDRNKRVKTMRKQLEEHKKENVNLLKEQAELEKKRDIAFKENTKVCERTKFLDSKLRNYHKLISLLCTNTKAPVSLPSKIPEPGPSTGSLPPAARNMVTAAARKRPFAYKYTCSLLADLDLSDNSSGADLYLNNMCNICKGRNDQHLLAKCDTCHQYYHLGCLNPPLTRMPKKTKLMGWQCSECDRNSSSEDIELDTDAPRKLRHKETVDSSMSDYKFDTDISCIEQEYLQEEPELESLGVTPENVEPIPSKPKKRKREKHHRYSPDPNEMRHRKHKHKKSKPVQQQEEQRQSLKICFKSVPKTGGGSSYVATPSASLASTSYTVSVPRQPTPPPRQSTSKKRDEIKVLTCATCDEIGDSSNIVQCDECLLGFHFQCLVPPVKKSPKVRGYSWHCANCDPTESD